MSALDEYRQRHRRRWYQERAGQEHGEDYRHTRQLQYEPYASSSSSVQQRAEQGTSSGWPENTYAQRAAPETASSSHQSQVDYDEGMRRRLFGIDQPHSRSEDNGASSSSAFQSAVPSAPPAAPSEHSVSEPEQSSQELSDEQLARMLQEQYDREAAALAQFEGLEEGHLPGGQLSQRAPRYRTMPLDHHFYEEGNPFPIVGLNELQRQLLNALGGVHYRRPPRSSHRHRSYDQDDESDSSDDEGRRGSRIRRFMRGIGSMIRRLHRHDEDEDFEGESAHPPPPPPQQQRQVQREQPRRRSAPRQTSSSLPFLFEFNPSLQDLFLQLELGPQLQNMSYEELTELERRLGSVHRGADQETIEQSSARFRLDRLDPNNKDCVICMEDFKVGEEVRRLQCLHVYHADCIDKWLHTNKQCPVCRTDVA